MMLAAQAQLIQHFTESAQQLDSETAAAEQGIKEKYEKEIKELMHFINCCKMSEWPSCYLSVNKIWLLS